MTGLNPPPGQACPNCGAWFQEELKVEIDKISWHSKKGGFTVYGRTFCSCGYRTDNPQRWWEKWKSIPVSVVKPTECPACKSHDIDLESMDTSKEKDEIVIMASFLCKNCNRNRKQFVRGLKDFWLSVKTISIGPEGVTLHKDK